jgi:hypothetical protein
MHLVSYLRHLSDSHASCLCRRSRLEFEADQEDKPQDAVVPASTTTALSLVPSKPVAVAQRAASQTQALPVVDGAAPANAVAKKKKKPKKLRTLQSVLFSAHGVVRL